MTNFENFIANTDSTATITISGIGYKCGFKHTTTPNNVSINGDRVMFLATDFPSGRYVHTIQKEIRKFEIVN